MSILGWLFCYHYFSRTCSTSLVTARSALANCSAMEAMRTATVKSEQLLFREYLVLGGVIHMDSCVSLLELWIHSVASFVNCERAKGLLGTTLTSDTGMGMDTRICGQSTAIKQDLMNIRWTRTVSPVAAALCNHSSCEGGDPSKTSDW